MTICIQESPGRNQASLNLVLSFWESSSALTAAHRLFPELIHLLQRIASSHAKDVGENLAAKLTKKVPL